MVRAAMSDRPYIPWRTTYDPEAWRRKRVWLRRLVGKLGFTFLVRIEAVVGLENLPRQGRVVVIFNHIAFIDPLAVMYVSPRALVPMMKVEALDYPLIGALPRWWGAIPVRRGEVDSLAIRQALAVLEADEPLLIAPEGTRNPSLQRGKLGLAYLAARTGSPVVPVAIEGTEGYPTWPLSSRWRGPGVRLTIGRPFRFTVQQRHPRRQLLQKMTDEAMYVLAGLLPPERRGVYADLSRATQETIRWL